MRAECAKGGRKIIILASSVKNEKLAILICEHFPNPANVALLHYCPPPPSFNRNITSCCLS